MIGFGSQSVWETVKRSVLWVLKSLAMFTSVPMKAVLCRLWTSQIPRAVPYDIAANWLWSSDNINNLHLWMLKSQKRIWWIIQPWSPSTRCQDITAILLSGDFEFIRRKGLRPIRGIFYDQCRFAGNIRILHSSKVVRSKIFMKESLSISTIPTSSLHRLNLCHFAGWSRVGDSRATVKTMSYTNLTPFCLKQKWDAGAL